MKFCPAPCRKIHVREYVMFTGVHKRGPFAPTVAELIGDILWGAFWASENTNTAPPNG